MQLKAADGHADDLAELAFLLERPGPAADVRRRIDQEIRAIRAGEAGERDAAYEIEFHYGKRPNRVTIHDLRLEIDGRVAQIDHLLIDRLFTVWVCESKHFTEGVAVNNHGEWSRFFGGRPTGIPSPVVQNQRHIEVLRDAFDQRLIPLPRRLVVTLKPDIRNVVLVSNGARMSRPRSTAAERAAGMNHVIKVERFKEMIDADLDSRSPTTMGRLISETELYGIGQALVALHRPMATDWAARFGLSPRPSAPPTQVDQPRLKSGRGRDSGKICEACGIALSVGVVRYAQENTTRFGGRILCLACQRAASRG